MVSLSEIRAPLFVPANRPDRFVKAANSGADAVILDLEDAVAADEKLTAREALSCDFTDLPVIIRINAADREWFHGDIEAVNDLSVAGVMLPKSDCPEIVSKAVELLGGDTPLLPLIESACGLVNSRSIAAVSGVSRLVFGSIDYCADLGCAHLSGVLLPVRSELVLASRLASIAAPIDGVTPNVADPDTAREDAAHAREIGMTGKLCIHPSQIAPVLSAFAPSEEEIDWAERVLASGDGVASVDGAMIDEPVRIRARQILERI